MGRGVDGQIATLTQSKTTPVDSACMHAYVFLQCWIGAGKERGPT